MAALVSSESMFSGPTPCRQRAPLISVSAEETAAAELKDGLAVVVTVVVGVIGVTGVTGLTGTIGVVGGAVGG